jgi:hypothetical protein
VHFASAASRSTGLRRRPVHRGQVHGDVGHYRRDGRPSFAITRLTLARSTCLSCRPLVRLLYGLAIITLRRRHLGSTSPPIRLDRRQITEAFPWEQAPRYLIRDRDASYGHAVTRRLAAMGFLDRPTAARSPWQSGHAERLIGSVRRECLDHIVIMDELHLRRSWPLMPTITTASELIGHWPRTHRFIASLRGLAPLHRDRSSAAFTINIAESNIRYAQGG